MIQSFMVDIGPVALFEVCAPSRLSEELLQEQEVGHTCAYFAPLNHVVLVGQVAPQLARDPSQVASAALEDLHLLVRELGAKLLTPLHVHLH